MDVDILQTWTSTIGGPIQCVFHIEISTHTSYIILYKYPKAGDSFTVINWHMLDFRFKQKN